MAEKLFPNILVIGGTGTQGGNAARELLKHGHRVRVLARNPESLAAKRLEQLGAEIVQGDLREQATLVSAMKDVTALFSAQYSDPNDTSIELRNAYNMVHVAKETGVRQIIHTSVIGSNIFPRWKKSPLLSNLWEIKYEVEEYIRQGGFQYWTILHPSFFMENFAEPLSKYMAPELKQGKLFGVLHPETPIKLNCGEDTARFARGGFENPGKFNAKDINIASEELSMDQVATQLSEKLGRKITYEEVTVEEGVKRGLWEGTAQSHHWMNEVPGFGFDLNETLSFDIPLKSFEQWITENKSSI
ncbi:NmrA family protein [Sporocytophaga myxococcoides]|uniref:NmrA family protein n=1 Tax=Sporocytophaga myxococcoides TaxID=153721 RepID=A0A098LEA4_9BACT|nr:NmrA/HSCARG family protein [Sporocytophaga myxococcoides]GAL84747.1 NmrA family protein [Sporocytophaga myxococcoides]